MTSHLHTPLRPTAPPQPAPLAPDSGWHPRHLLWAPHRLGFFLATVLLLVSGGWWAGGVAGTWSTPCLPAWRTVR